MEPGAEAAKHAANGLNDLLVAHLGQAGTTLVWFALTFAFLVLALIFLRYVGVLREGGAEEGSLERRAYNELRHSLEEGGDPTRIYQRLLTAFLGRVDRFLGDEDQPQSGPLQNALRLRGSYPLWTGIAFDQCMLLALVYPVLVVLITWSISGQVGPADSSLGLRSMLPAWWRALLVGVPLIWMPAQTFLVTTYRRGLVRGGWAGGLFLATLAIGFGYVGATTQSGTGIGVGALSAACLVSFAISGFIRGTKDGSLLVLLILLLVSAEAGAVPIGLALYEAAGLGSTINSVSGALSDTLVATITETVGFICSAALAGLIFGAFWFLRERAIRNNWRGIFVAFTCVAIVVAAISSAYWMTNALTWKNLGPGLMFLGLLTALNAPFDWFSIGLTRALLRRGVELGGWWPYVLAFADATFGIATLIVLTGVLIVGIQAFDLAGTLSGGQAELPLIPLFNNIAAHPDAPSNWWAYAVLLSTMIPSLTNVIIGSISLTRGVPGISKLLLRAMPPARAVPEFDHYWIAAVLTAQWAVGFTLAVIAVFASAWIATVLFPEIGAWFLSYARWVAGLRLPEVAIAFFGR